MESQPDSDLLHGLDLSGEYSNFSTSKVIYHLEINFVTWTHYGVRQLAAALGANVFDK